MGVSTFFLLTLMLLLKQGFSDSIDEDGVKSNEISKESSTSVGQSFTWSKYNLLALGSAIFVVSVGLSTLISVFFPLLAYKLCYLFGACLDPFEFDSYRSVKINERSKRSSEYTDPILASLLKGYEKYNDYKEALNKPREKRSTQYIEPILTTLIQAYEKFADDDLKKKSEIPKF